MTITERTRRLVLTYLAEIGRPSTELSNETSLIRSGLLDSVDLLSLVLRIEEEFGIGVIPMEVTLDELDSVERIARYISQQDGDAS